MPKSEPPYEPQANRQPIEVPVLTGAGMEEMVLVIALPATSLHGPAKWRRLKMGLLQHCPLMSGWGGHSTL